MHVQSKDPMQAWAERGPIIAIGAELRALLSAEAVPRILRRAERLGGDPSEAGTLCLVDYGRARPGRLALGGRGVVLALARPGSLCSLPSVHAYPETLVGGTRTYCLAARSLPALVAAHPPVVSWLAVVLGRRPAAADDRIEGLTCCSVRSRVARALGRLAHAAPGGVVRIGRMELAQSAGQAASGSCRGTIRVLDVAGLLRA